MRGMMKGMTACEWLVWKTVGRSKEEKNPSTSVREAGDEIRKRTGKSKVLQMHPRREALFADLITALCMAEGVTSIVVSVFFVIVPTNPGEAGGEPLPTGLVLANMGIMVFFELVVGDYITVRVSEARHQRDPAHCLCLEKLFSNRKGRAHAVYALVLVITTVATTLDMMGSLCVEGNGGAGPSALLTLCTDV